MSEKHSFGDIYMEATTLSSNLLFDMCSPNNSLLQKVLSFDADNLDSLPDPDVTKCVLVLSQYLVSIKYRENDIRAQKFAIDKELNKKVMFCLSTKTWKSGVTLKEKTSSTIEENEDLKSLEFRSEIAEGQLLMLGGMYESFVELMNAYKREQTRRSGTR
jgi:hypothetical protein